MRRRASTCTGFADPQPPPLRVLNSHGDLSSMGLAHGAEGVMKCRKRVGRRPSPVGDDPRGRARKPRQGPARAPRRPAGSPRGEGGGPRRGASFCHGRENLNRAVLFLYHDSVPSCDVSLWFAESATTRARPRSIMSISIFIGRGRPQTRALRRASIFRASMSGDGMMRVISTFAPSPNIRSSGLWPMRPNAMA